MTHTPLIQYAIDKIGAKSYLEIGINNPDNNFNQIKCQFKIGVDPNPLSKASFTGTSDEFFKMLGEQLPLLDTFSVSPPMFDVVFIDGLHWWIQVVNDFNNALRYLKSGGVIIIHDTDPKEERFAVYPRVERGRWNGDVYKFIARLPMYGKIDWRTPETDPNGLTLVKKSEREMQEPAYNDCDYKTFKENRKEILNLCTWEQLKEWL